MLKKISCLLFLIVTIALTGCASNADVAGMTYSYQGSKNLHNPILKQNISVGSVSGGHETNPLWTSQINNGNFKAALERSLQTSKLSATNKPGLYLLNAQLVHLEQPFAGLDMTVDCLVHYQLFKQGSAKALYDKNISASYTARFGDSLIAIERLKKANEGAARENFKKLIDDLYQLPL